MALRLCMGMLLLMPSPLACNGGNAFLNSSEYSDCGDLAIVGTPSKTMVQASGAVHVHAPLTSMVMGFCWSDYRDYDLLWIVSEQLRKTITERDAAASRKARKGLNRMASQGSSAELFKYLGLRHDGQDVEMLIVVRHTGTNTEGIANTYGSEGPSSGSKNTERTDAEQARDSPDVDLAEARKPPQ